MNNSLQPESLAGQRRLSLAGLSASARNNLGVILALLSLYIIWGSTYLAMRYAIISFPAFFMSGSRFLIAGTILFLFSWGRGAPLPSRREWLGAGLVGSLLLVGGNGLVAFAEQWVVSGLAALAIATTPLWAALFAGLWGRWPVRLEWLGLAVGFAGIILLNLENNLLSNPLGAALLLLAPASWAFGSIWSRHLALPQGLMASAAEMLVAGLILIVLSIIRQEGLPQTLAPSSLIAMAYLIFFGSLIAYTSYSYLLRHVRPVLATSYAYVNPAVAVALGIGLAGEKITWIGIAAMLVILSGVGLIAFAREKQGAE